MRSTRVAALAAAALIALTGCTGGDGDGDDGGLSGPTSSATEPQPVPSVDSSSKGAIALRGDWEAPDVQWILHLEEDGSFTEDFEGTPDFRSGTWEVEGDTIRLFGGDGNTDEGTIDGDSLVFELGTLVRQ